MRNRRFRWAPLPILAALLLLVPGCLDDDQSSKTDDLPASDEGHEPELVLPKVNEFEAGGFAVIRTPLGTLGLLATPPPVMELGGNLTGLIAEASWNPSTQLSDILEFAVWQGQTLLGAVQGTSPLRLEWSGEGTPTGAVSLEVTSAANPGAYLNQVYTIHVSQFIDVPFDPSFSAL